MRSSRKVVNFVAKLNTADLLVLQELLAAGKVTPVIDRRYELSAIADALRYLGEGHAQGKTIDTDVGVRQRKARKTATYGIPPSLAVGIPPRLLPRTHAMPPGSPPRDSVKS